MWSAKPSSAVTTNQRERAEQIETEARGVVEEQTRDREGRDLHDDVDDLAADLEERLQARRAAARSLPAERVSPRRRAAPRTTSGAACSACRSAALRPRECRRPRRPDSTGTSVFTTCISADSGVAGFFVASATLLRGIAAVALFEAGARRGIDAFAGADGVRHRHADHDRDRRDDEGVGESTSSRRGRACARRRCRRRRRPATRRRAARRSSTAAAGTACRSAR